MADRIQFRRDTAERWQTINPILQEGELGIETDTRFTKVGDGVHAWNDLQYSTAVHNITSELGTSENLVMTQKGVKDALDKIKEDGKTGYLGALGEWQAVGNNKTKVNSAMSLIGGTAFTTYNNYWSSTQYSDLHSWKFYWYSNSLNGENRHSTYGVRAFCSLS